MLDKYIIHIQPCLQDMSKTCHPQLPDTSDGHIALMMTRRILKMRHALKLRKVTNTTVTDIDCRSVLNDSSEIGKDRRPQLTDVCPGRDWPPTTYACQVHRSYTTVSARCNRETGRHTILCSINHMKSARTVAQR